MRDAADAAGLRRIVYLGGMGSGDGLSKHLASRHRVGEILASGRTATTELRAAVIIGSGSISFEMLRYLTEVLPAMITPRWVRTKCQPIAISDVLHYLTAVLDDPETVDRVLEIGGPDVVTYAEMMQTYAEVAGLPASDHRAGPSAQPTALVAVGRSRHSAAGPHRGPSHRLAAP